MPCPVLIALHISLVWSKRNLIYDRTTASAKCRSTVNLFGYFDIWFVGCCYYVHRTGDWSERRKWRRERKSTKQKTKKKLEIIKIALLNETELKPVFSFFSAFSVDCCLPPFLPSVSLWSALEIFALPFFVQRTTRARTHNEFEFFVVKNPYSNRKPATGAEPVHTFVLKKTPSTHDAERIGYNLYQFDKHLNVFVSLSVFNTEKPINQLNDEVDTQKKTKKNRNKQTVCNKKRAKNTLFDIHSLDESKFIHKRNNIYT